MVGYSIRKGSAVSTGPTYIEMGDTRYKMMNDNDGNRGSVTLYGSADIANELAMPVSSDDLDADMSANPTEELFLHVFAYALDSASDPNAIRCAVTIDYSTKFREKKTLTTS